MFCSNCNKELPDDAKFCDECGAKIEPTEVVEASAEETAEPVIDVKPIEIASAPVAAAVEAAPAPVVDTKAEEKKAKKAEKKAEKKAAKDEKKNQKKAAKDQKKQELIDSCPKEYKPVGTSAYFWLGFLFSLPVVGLIASIIRSVIGWNRNMKSFARSYVVGHIILIILLLGFLAAAFIFGGSDVKDVIYGVGEGLGDMAYAIFK